MNSSALGDIEVTKKLSEIVSLPMAAQDYLSLTRQVESNKDYNLMLEIYEAGLKAYPESEDINLSFARFLIQEEAGQLQDPPRAVKLAEKGIELTENPDGHALEILAMTYFENKQFAKAVEAIKKACKVGHCQHIKDRLPIYLKALNKVE